MLPLPLDAASISLRNGINKKINIVLNGINYMYEE
jgi:hypothetical protein